MKSFHNGGVCQDQPLTKLSEALAERANCRGALPRPLTMPGPGSQPCGFGQGCAALKRGACGYGFHQDQPGQKRGGGQYWRPAGRGGGGGGGGLVPGDALRAFCEPE